MVDINPVREKINAVLARTDLNRQIEIQRYTVSTNSYGEMVYSFSSQEVIRTIVIDYRRNSFKYDDTGQYQDARSIALFEHDFSINKQDRIHFDDKDHEIMAIVRKPAIGDGDVYTRVFLREITEE